MNRFLHRLLPALVGSFLAFPAGAHQTSGSYLELAFEADRIVGRWDMALVDLEAAIGLDEDGSGTITWGELKARHEAVATYALGRLSITGDGRPCPLEAGGQAVAEHADGAYAVLGFAARCLPGSRDVALSYRLLFDLDGLHRGLLRAADGDAAHTAVLTAETPDFTFVRQAPPDLARQVLAYGAEGVRHIWIGIDHILFLLSLLLPAVLRREDGHWRAVAGFGEAAAEVLKIVTAFTLAHSLTLTLATLGVVALPSRLVESAIAASVVLAALNNIRPLLVGRGLWLAALSFGLVHGLGFAGALGELGLPRTTLLVSLAAFNLGVELGQLAIVAAFLPLAFLVRRTWLYPRLVVAGGSAAIAVLAGIWLVERAFALPPS